MVALVLRLERSAQARGPPRACFILPSGCVARGSCRDLEVGAGVLLQVLEGDYVWGYEIGPLWLLLTQGCILQRVIMGELALRRRRRCPVLAVLLAEDQLLCCDIPRAEVLFLFFAWAAKVRA